MTPIAPSKKPFAGLTDGVNRDRIRTDKTSVADSANRPKQGEFTKMSTAFDQIFAAHDLQVPGSSCLLCEGGSHRGPRGPFEMAQKIAELEAVIDGRDFSRVPYGIRLEAAMRTGNWFTATNAARHLAGCAGCSVCPAASRFEGASLA